MQVAEPHNNPTPKSTQPATLRVADPEAVKYCAEPPASNRNQLSAAGFVTDQADQFSPPEKGADQSSNTNKQTTSDLVHATADLSCPANNRLGTLGPQTDVKEQEEQHSTDKIVERSMDQDVGSTDSSKESKAKSIESKITGVSQSLQPPPVPPSTWGKKIALVFVVLLLGVGTYLYYGKLGQDATEKLIVEAQVAFDRRDLGAADKLVVEALRQKPDHPAARKLNSEIQARYTSLRKSLSEAKTDLSRNRINDARRRVEEVLGEDPDNKNAMDLRRQIDVAAQAAVSRCNSAAQEGMTLLVATNNVERARRKLQEARGTGAECEGIQTLSDALATAEQHVAEAPKPAQAPPPQQTSIIPPVPVAAPAPASDNVASVALKQIERARRKLNDEQWSTAIELAMSAKETAPGNSTVRAEADKLIDEATRQRARQKNDLIIK